MPLAGWNKQEIAIIPRGYAMQGYGQSHHRAFGVQSPLFARAVVIADDHGKHLVFCCLDLGYVTHAMREGICRELRMELGADFDEDFLVLTCTHTHSGPGGCSQDAMYNLVTPGFVPEHVTAIVTAARTAIVAAWRALAPTELELVQGAIAEEVPVAWNRSLAAYNRNPDVTPRRPGETHLALDRGMSVLGLRREGRVVALLSLFGVHATCVGNSLHKHDGDNKGYAAAHAERELEAAGAAGAVAIFAQATAGDVSPHYQGPGDIARRAQIKGEAEYAYAQRNGRFQSEHALALLQAGQATKVEGALDAIFGYTDFTAIHADPLYADGEPEAWTSEPCHGVTFFAGTRVDGPGMVAAAIALVKKLARAVKARRLKHLSRYSAEDQAYFRRLYAAQGDKDIMFEAGRKLMLGMPLHKLPLPGFVDATVAELKRQARVGALRESAMVPTVLPLQLVRIGGLVLVCCPGEFTTVAGARLRETVARQLEGQGVTQVLICTYCNDYMGYVTTREEYREQAYEGGHTIFGQWTLAAFQTRFAALAREFGKEPAQRRHDRSTRPRPAPAAELALRSRLAPGGGGVEV